MKELKKKKKQETSVQIQYVPYEHYVSRILTNMKTQLDLIEKHIDGIKECIALAAKKDEKE